jgi:hypothetical protein
MALFKKEKIPEIPMAPSLPDVTEKKELPELPSFPNNNKNNNLNQEMVKSAISDNYSPGENEVNSYGEYPSPVLAGGSSIPLLPGKQSIMEEDVQMPPIQSNFMPIENIPIVEPPKKKMMPSKLVTAKANVPAVRTHSIPNPRFNRDESDIEPIFIRIDKFQLAKKNIEQIKEKVDEMEGIIGKIKQIKTKEEEEIKSWSQEIENLKIRLSEIDSNVFSQI